MRHILINAKKTYGRKVSFTKPVYDAVKRY
jgi:hypothetical protein